MEGRKMKKEMEMSSLDLRLETANGRLGRGMCFYRMLTLTCMMIFVLSGALAGADGNPRKTVRVAYQEFDRLLIVDEHNTPVSGYAYDYIQTIATYAGWDVKYIPCASFSECVNKLLAGETDLFYDVSYTEERAKVILFPNEPMAYEYYYLYSSAENTSITPGD